MNVLKRLTPKLPNMTTRNVMIAMVILLWCLFIFWLWRAGTEFTLMTYKPFASLLHRWLITLFSAIGLLIYCLYFLYQQLNLLKLQRLQHKKVDSDPVQTHLNHQKHYLEQWLLALQQQLMVKGFRYTLPWYLIIGGVGAGKSTFLAEGCKLNALFLSEQPQLVQCWLTEQAVIIEADGALFEQTPQDTMPALYEKLWKQLLAWLVTARPRQPLNGVIVATDIYQFSTFTKYEKDRYIAQLKARLHEITQSLHTHLPVYLVLTKLDLLYGFQAMFQTLSKAERDEIVGVTFAADDQNWHNTFNHFWQTWVKQLNSAMPEMMINRVDVKQRSQLFTFIRQVNGIKAYIDQLIDHCFFSLKAPLHFLQGVYLTSSTQKGQMEDLFVKSAASQFNLPEQVYPSWQSPLSYPYFTHNLLGSLLFSEGHLASENHHYQKYHQRQCVLWGMAMVLVSCATMAGWNHFYHLNYRAGEEALLKTQQYMRIPLPEQKDYLGNLQLPLLDPIGDATIAYGNYHNRNRLLSDMGLYQGYKIGPYVEGTYLNLLQHRFLPAIMNGLQRDLEQAPSGSEEKLNILRIMRMIEDESGRDAQRVIQYMQSRWSQAFKGERALQHQLYRHLVYALAHINWKAARMHNDSAAINSFLPYQQSIQEAQADLTHLPIYQRVYQNLRSQAKTVLPIDLNIRNQIGAGFNMVFTPSSERLLDIPQLLTRNGLVNYFVHQDNRLIQLTSLDSWVLALTQNSDFSEEDSKEIQRQITARYLNDYIATWRTAYTNLHIKQFDNIPAAIQALEQVTHGEQIFQRAIQLLQTNTAVNDPEGPAISTEIINQRDYQILNTLHHEFRQDISVILENSDQVSALQNAATKIANMHRYLLAIQNSPSPGKSALQAVQFRIEHRGSDPIFEAQQLAKSIPDPLGRWLDELATETWNIIMVEAIKSLEIEWNKGVVHQYKRYFADRYPFDPNAKLDVPLSEFERFFGYGGTLDSFYQKNLKAFVENDLTIDHARNVLIRSDVLKQLKQAEKIRQIYFTPQGLGIQFSLQPIDMSGNRRRGVLNLDGQLVDYNHAGNTPIHLIWPNSMRDNIESRLTLISGNGKVNKPLLYSGPWGLIRLINAGTLTNVKENTFDIRYDIDNAYITYRIHVDESDNPFAGGLFSHFTLSETLY